MTDDYGSYIRSLQTLNLSSRLLTKIKDNLPKKKVQLIKLTNKQTKLIDQLMQQKDSSSDETNKNPLAELLSDIFKNLPNWN